MSGARTRAKKPRGGRKGEVAYEKAKVIARGPDSTARRRLAARKDVRPEILYYLAEDPEPEIRRVIAGNPAAPAHADLILARDVDGEVRSGLAAKIADLIPGLPSQDRSRVRDLTIEVIAILARDQLPRVRIIVAEALAEITGAPPPLIRDVVRHLAQDEVLQVAAPILERSVLLSDEDLLEIIRSGPIEGALSAIARRAELGPGPADAVAEGEDTDAITALLANPSAQIREETLDRIVDRAPNVPPWHAPLVRRPVLSANVARRIAGFVARSLLEVLRRREDLDPETARAVAAAVDKRLDVEDSRKAEEAPKERPKDRARRLHAAGKLTEEAISRAVGSGDRGFATAALALRSGLLPEIVREIIASKSAKAVTAVAWKAELSMRLAMQMQMRLAGIAPSNVLHARDGVDFPLSPEDMTWQLEFFGG